jgi:hypothetical protein
VGFGGPKMLFWWVFGSDFGRFWGQKRVVFGVFEAKKGHF